MNARSPYLASGVGHALVLGGLLTLSTLQRPPAFVPGVRIVAVAGRGGGGAATIRREPPAAAKPPAPAPAAKPPEPKEAKKSPPKREPTPEPHPKGVQPPRPREIVSKSPGRQPEAPTGPATQTGTTTPAAAAAAGSGVGIEAEGDNGLVSGYLGLLRDKVASAWQPPPTVGRSGQVRAVVYFTIDRQGGEPRSLAVQESSGVALFDRAALSAVLGAAPLQPLPSAWGYDSIAIKFTFFQQY